MAPRNFHTGEMIEVCEVWLDQKRLRPIFERIARLKPLLPDIESAQQQLIAFEPRNDTKTQKEVAEVRAEEAIVDERHDRKLRGCILLLKGLEELSDKPEDATAWSELSVRMFGEEGLATINAGYAEEAGRARRAAEQLTDESVQKMLAAVVLPGSNKKNARTLLTEAQSYVREGRLLGVLESKKSELEAKQQQNEGGEPRRSGSVDARNRWGRVVRAVLSTAALLEGEEAERAAPVLRDFADRETKADARARRSRKEAPNGEENPVEGADKATD